MCIDRSAPSTPTPTAITNSPNSPSRTSFAPMPLASPEKKSDEQDDRRDLGDRGGDGCELSKRRTDLTRVLQDRNHDPGRGG